LCTAQFETIHPFIDGNGRLGRLLIGALLEQWGLLAEPLLVPSGYMKKHQAEYYRRLSAIRIDGDWKGWICRASPWQTRQKLELYNASQLQRTPPTMKTSTLPSLRVEPELRAAAEQVLQEGESLSAFVETSVRETIERRRTRAEFIARGLVSREAAKRTGAYIAAEAVHDDLAKMLADAKAKLSKAPKRARR
jgi:hypothetical protein